MCIFLFGFESKLWEIQRRRDESFCKDIKISRNAQRHNIFFVIKIAKLLCLKKIWLDSMEKCSESLFEKYATRELPSSETSTRDLCSEILVSQAPSPFNNFLVQLFHFQKFNRMQVSHHLWNGNRELGLLKLNVWFQTRMVGKTLLSDASIILAAPTGSGKN